MQSLIRHHNHQHFFQGHCHVRILAKMNGRSLLVSVEVARATDVFMFQGKLRRWMRVAVPRNEIAVGFQDRLYLLQAGICASDSAAPGTGDRPASGYAFSDRRSLIHYSMS